MAIQLPGQLQWDMATDTVFTDKAKEDLTEEERDFLTLYNLRYNMKHGREEEV